MRIGSSNRRTLAVTALLAIAAGIASGVGGGPSQQAKLVAADAANEDHFGVAVAVAGETAVVGAYHKNVLQGAAYVFTRSPSGDWTQEAELTDSDGAGNDYFGYAVAVAGDTALVGAVGKNTGRGAAFVFTRTGTTWTQQAMLEAADGASGDAFGISVALAGDSALVGANGVNSDRGAAYVFTRTGTAWTQQAKLTAADGATQDEFGYSVGLAGDTAVAGAYGGISGKAYVFTRTGTAWTQEAKLTAADAAPDSGFGTAVAVAGDTAVVGALGTNSGRGAAYVFTRPVGTWTQEAKLTATDGVDGDQFGVSVALEGDTVVAGAGNKASARGAAYVFTRAGTTWRQRAKLVASDPADSDHLGASLAVADGTVVVGADRASSFHGAAYVFVVPAGAGPSPGYLLATKVRAKANAAHPERSTLTASGTLDTGTGVPDFTGAATLVVGGFHLDIPAFVAKGRSLRYGAGGVTLTLTPARNGSSHATFSVKIVGDLTDRVGVNAPLAFSFTNAANGLTGAVTLTSGAVGPHGVTSPNLSVRSASATVKGSGKDSLKLTLGFATGGTPPGTPDALTIGFGGTYTATLAGNTFVRKGNADTHKAKAPGITKATVDYAKGTITITGTGLDLGTFAAGGGPVFVDVTLGADKRTVGVRMTHTGTKLSY